MNSSGIVDAPFPLKATMPDNLEDGLLANSYTW